MRHLTLAVACWLFFCQSAAARDVSAPGWFKCLEGDCKNGSGVVLDLYLHVSIRGRFSGGQTIPGEEYILTSPLAPGRTFKQIYGADGLLESGDSPRTVALMSTKIGNFNGSYKAFQHPFTQRPMAVISEGRYETGIGITYSGQFRFLPSKYGSDTGMGSGYYIFFGDRFDEIENEHKVGLFVTNVVMPGSSVQFFEANPEFLAGMQEKYRAEMNLAQTERSASSSFWKSLLSFVGNVALNMSGAGGGLGGIGGGGLTSALSGAAGLNAPLLGGGGGIGGKIALNLVSSMFDGKPGINFEDAAKSAISSVVPDTAAGNAIASALLDTNGAGGNLGSRLVNAAGNAAISNVENKLSAAVGGGTGGSLATATLKSAFSGTAPGKGEAQGFGQALTANAPQTLASTLAGNPSSQGGVLLGAAMASLAQRSSERQEAASRAAGYQRADQEISATITEISAIAKTQPGNASQKPPNAEQNNAPRAEPVAPVQPRVAPSQDAGSVSLTYTPGKGFWDPVANKFIKSPELMSCDNVTTTGVKLIDLPLEKRACVVSSPVKQAAPRKPSPPVQAPAVARVAELELISPPENMQFEGSELIAVNEGFYVALKSDDGMSGAGKYAQDGWLTTKIARGPVEIAIPNHRRQGINEFSLRYIASDKEKGDRYGWMNMNNGALVIDEANDLHLAVTKYVTLLDDTKSARSIALGNQKIYWEKSGWVGREFSGRYDGHDLSGVSLRLAADTGEHLSVYMVGADGRSIVNVSVEGTQRERFDLSPFGGGIVNTLIYKHNKLFVGYGDQILLIKDGKVSQFLKLEGVLATQRATFCISNGRMFTADGRYVQSVDTFDKALSPAPFLVTGPPPPEKMNDIIMMRAGIQTGIYCEDGDYYPHVFAFGTDLKSNSQKIMKIYPLQ